SAASVSDDPSRKAFKSRRSRPASPVAKSLQTPLRALILKEPGRSSARVGFLATYSSPSHRPPGSQRGRSERAEKSAVSAISLKLSGADLISAPKRSVLSVIEHAPEVSAGVAGPFYDSCSLM